ncbi:MAG TPA: tetratricopeptide repeat protein [Usitatibacter sp.]|nr:tetratricopeptide repeat protein [Usitatibacter sp.]
MAAPIEVELLGHSGFRVGGEALACASRKALWLAAYLLLERKPVTRASVAALVWGPDSPRHALGSLRVAITKLPQPVLACLEVTRDTLGVAPDARVALDVDAFAQSCAATDIEGQLAGLEIYRGELMHGAENDTAPEFVDWLLPRRERARQLAHDAHLRVAQQLHARGDRVRARQVVDAWLRHDSASESFHGLLMTWLPSDQALAQYEVYRRARAVTLGAAPSSEMAARAERLRRGSEPAMREIPSRLTAATSFIGRNDELAELRGLLADPSCRLLTLHGMGGVGKTRLASAIAEHESGEFPDGVHVCALDELQAPALFAQTLARACGLHPSGSQAPLDLVVSFLGDHAVLLVLDNLEHLLAEGTAIAGQIARLLAATGPRVKVLATSREPLGLQEEWLYELRGLSYPRVDEAAQAQGFAAVQFFAQRARQAYLGFSLAAELPNVVRICDVVEGLPLGLELAASWVRSVPCAEIAASLAEHATQLATRHVNRAARHHSLGAVIAYSWDRLPAEQREALSALAVLRGTFSREAAEHVARANVRTLSALADKALLQRIPEGRWHIHEVVRQFAGDQGAGTAKARAARQASVGRLRDGHYMGLLERVGPRLHGPDEAEGYATIEMELANIRAAWQSCALAGDLDAMAAAAPAWMDFLEKDRFVDEGRTAVDAWLHAALARDDALSAGKARMHSASLKELAGQLAEALEAVELAIPVLEAKRAKPEHAKAMMNRGVLLSHLGRVAEAEAQARHAIEAARALDDRWLLAQCLTVLGFIVIRLGKGAEARDLQLQALALVEVLGKPSAIARVSNNLALAENFLGNYQAAEAGYERALGLWRSLGMIRVAGLAMHNLGVVAQRTGDYALALQRYREGLELLQRAGDRKMIALNLISTGDALVRIGRASEARAPLTEGLRIAQRDAHALVMAYAYPMLAHAEITLGNTHQAASHLMAGFDIAETDHYTDVMAESVVNAARLLIAASPGSESTALGWVRELSASPEASARVHDDAKRMIESLTPAEAGVATGRTLEELARAAKAAVRRFISSATPSGADTATYAESHPSAS